MATLSIDRPITPLRQRMLDDMAVRGLREHTRRDYIRHVRRFAAFLGRSPDTATPDDVRRFQVYQTQAGATASTIKSAVSALRFLFSVTLDRPDLARRLTIMRNPRKAPDVLSVDEVARLLQAAPNIKYKAALGVAYGAGLRASEVTHLKVDDIDSQRMLIRVEQGKGRKDRNAIVDDALWQQVQLHCNKGLAGAPEATRKAALDTATHPAVVQAFALALIADIQESAYPGERAPDLAAARKDADAIASAAAALRACAPDAGSYVSESDYFNPRWQDAYWGRNHARLAAIKAKYDADGLFFVHHGIGSEGWSRDGFERLER